MVSQQTPKKHHYVPRCYLKNFATDGSLQVLNIDKISKGINHSVRKASPKNICFYEDYYTIDDDKLNMQFQLQALDKLFIESVVLGALEDKYGKYLFNHLTTQNSLPFIEAVEFSDFLIQLKIRNPYWFEASAKKKDETIDNAIKDITGKYDKKFDHIPEEIKQMVVDHVAEENKANPNFSKKMQLFGLLNRSPASPHENTKVREAVLDCSWKLFSAPKVGPKFITSDNPGFAIGRDGKIYNTKFRDGFAFYLPISPNHCLVISDNKKDNFYTKKGEQKIIESEIAEPDTVIFINNAAIQIQNGLLIASDDWYLNQIAKINKPK